MGYKHLAEFILSRQPATENLMKILNSKFYS